MSVPGYSIWIGRLLVLVGIVGYGYGMFAGSASLTALIPAIFGLLLMLFGHIANSNESKRKLMMHLAVVVALLGFILPMGRLVSNLGGLSLSAALVSQLAMALLCLVFLVVGIRSFVAARKAN